MLSEETRRSEEHMRQLQSRGTIHVVCTWYDTVSQRVFNIKKKDLPWQSQNSEDEWNKTLRKVRLGIFKLYFEFVKKERVYH